MGLQLIFVVETNKKCKSDWIYIKDTIEYLYQYDRSQHLFTPVYMDGKGKYKNKEKEIKSYISQYASTSKTNQTKVIYCFDCDDYDKKTEDAEFLKNAQQYCCNHGYEFVWFCKDIERVYLGRQVEDSKKKTEAAVFKEKKQIVNVDVKKLAVDSYQTNVSNIMIVLDKYLIRKSTIVSEH